MNERPNVVFLFADQQRADTVSCYGAAPGAGLALTPNLDRMAAEGVRFDLAMTCQPVCGPARACLQTGIYPSLLGCSVNDRALPAGTVTVADRFRAAGYATGYVGKWHLASNRSFGEAGPDSFDCKTAPVPPERRGGYEYWMAADVLEFTSHGYGGYVYDGEGRKVSFDGYRADALTEYALDWLRQPKDRPFFLFVSWLEPHHQNDRNRCECPDRYRDAFREYEVPADLAETGGDWREEMPAYLGCCRSLDDNAGRILDCLGKLGLLENTIVVYTADHGCHFRTRNGEYKRSAHDASLHVPLLIRGPGFRGGKTVRQLTSLIDLPPTLLDAAGIPVPEEMQGHSLLPLGADPSRSVRDEVFAEISESTVGRAIRTRAFTYCAEVPLTREELARWSSALWAGKDEEHNPLAQPFSDVYRETLLYDNRNDPGQRINRIGDAVYRSVRDELRERLRAAIRREEGREAKILPYQAEE